MQPTTNQTVPETSYLPIQAADRQPSTVGHAPALLDAEALRQISGGVTSSTSLPVGTW